MTTTQTLYTVEVFEASSSTQSEGPKTDVKLIGEYQNMLSAKVMDGKILELEHSRLAGPDVKFKTVVDYSKSIEENNSLGVHLIRQGGYIMNDS